MNVNATPPTLPGERTFVLHVTAWMAAATIDEAVKRFHDTLGQHTYAQNPQSPLTSYRIRLADEVDGTDACSNDQEGSLSKAEATLTNTQWGDTVEALNAYATWRRAGGPEPKDGDQRADRVADQLAECLNNIKVETALLRNDNEQVLHLLMSLYSIWCDQQRLPSDGAEELLSFVPGLSSLQRRWLSGYCILWDAHEEIEYQRSTRRKALMQALEASRQARSACRFNG